MRIKTHPLMGTINYLYYTKLRKIRYHSYLDYYLYNKSEAMLELSKELDYVPYQYKHNESVFTRFYQNFILPEKFGFDKRRVHHSNEICTGQMTREFALADLSANSYVQSGEARRDRSYVLKKLGMSEDQFDKYLAAPAVSHFAYSSELGLLRRASKFYRLIKNII